jgi:Ca2+-transporting ATPase
MCENDSTIRLQLAIVSSGFNKRGAKRWVRKYGKRNGKFLNKFAAQNNKINTSTMLGEAQVSPTMDNVNQSLLDSLNVEQAKDENRENLDKLGGIDKLAKILGLNVETGLSSSQVETLRARFGDNSFPESPMETYLALLFNALTDTTLLILIAAATVSLVIGVITEPGAGWIEGAAIFIAIFLVSNISAGNDYSKQIQFKALEASSAKDERCSVLRDGVINRVNPNELVVGDIIVLQVK